MDLFRGPLFCLSKRWKEILWDEITEEKGDAIFNLRNLRGAGWGKKGHLLTILVPMGPHLWFSCWWGLQTFESYFATDTKRPWEKGLPKWKSWTARFVDSQISGGGVVERQGRKGGWQGRAFICRLSASLAGTERRRKKPGSTHFLVFLKKERNPRVFN